MPNKTWRSYKYLWRRTVWFKWRKDFLTVSWNMKSIATDYEQNRRSSLSFTQTRTRKLLCPKSSSIHIGGHEETGTKHSARLSLYAIFPDLCNLSPSTFSPPSKLAPYSPIIDIYNRTLTRCIFHIKIIGWLKAILFWKTLTCIIRSDIVEQWKIK